MSVKRLTGFKDWGLRLSMFKGLESILCLVQDMLKPKPLTGGGLSKLVNNGDI